MKREIEVEHLKNGKEQPIITLVRVKTDEAIATGVAICSKKDTFNGKLGRKIALGRAFKALVEKEDGRKVNRYEAVTRMKEYGTMFTHKSYYAQN